MDPRHFTASAPGRLVPTQTRKGPDVGFIPDPLPASWEMPPATRELLREAHAAIGRLCEAARRLRAPDLAVSVLQLREAIASSASSRPAAVTRALLRFEAVREGPHRDPHKAWRNALHYRRVLRRTLAAYPATPLRRLIQDSHADLFAGRPRRSVFPGRLRRGFIQMGDGAHYVPPPYAWVVPCLARMERDLSRPSSIDPLVRAFMAHYQFVTIHPFADGNGRVGRLLLAAMLNAAVLPQRPLLYVSAFFARFKEKYVNRLFRVNTHGDWQPWIELCLQATAASVADALRRLAALERTRGEWRSRFATRNDLPADLLDELLGQPGFNRARLVASGQEGALRALLEAGLVVSAQKRSEVCDFFSPTGLALLEADNL